MRVIRVQRDVYRVGADGSRDSLFFTASELIDLYDWLLLNYQIIEGDKQNDTAHSDKDERSEGVDRQNKS